MKTFKFSPPYPHIQFNRFSPIQLIYFKGLIVYLNDKENLMNKN